MITLVMITMTRALTIVLRNTKVKDGFMKLRSGYKTHKNMDSFYMNTLNVAKYICV